MAQVSPAHGKLFVKTMERALACTEGTAVVFVPAPCISGWKFDDGQAIHIGELGAQVGVFPVFVWERGKGGSVKDCPLSRGRAAARSRTSSGRSGASITWSCATPSAAASSPARVRKRRWSRLKEWTQKNVERLYGLAELK